MSNSKHEAGPWFYREEDIDIGTGEYIEPVIVTAPDDRGRRKYIAVVVIGHESSMANGRLIAAAPDLLEERKAMVRFYDMIDWDGGSDAVADAHEDRIEQIRTAIKKAEGAE